MKRTVRITAPQSDWLALLIAEARRAQQVADAVLTTLLRGAGITGGAALVGLDGPRLTVELPDRHRKASLPVPQELESGNGHVRTPAGRTYTGPRPPKVKQ